MKFMVQHRKLYNRSSAATTVFFSTTTLLVQSLILLRFLNLVTASHVPFHNDNQNEQLAQEDEEHEAHVSEIYPEIQISTSSSTSSDSSTKHVAYTFPKLKNAFAECSMHEIKIFVQFDSIFDGRIYASDYADDKTYGINAKNHSMDIVEFNLPLEQCGVQMTTPLDEEIGLQFLRYDVLLYIQYSAFVQQVADEMVAVSCMQARAPVEENIEQKLESESEPEPLQRRSRQGRLLKGKSLNSQVTSKTAAQIGEAFMEIISGKDPAPKSKKIVPVFVGEDVTLVISTKVMRGYDARIVNCSVNYVWEPYVNDGSRNINDGSRVQQILDSAGCTIDRSLVPNFRRRRLPIESRNRLITLHFASFPAFKFPERDHIHMKCSVAYCAGPCPQEVCDNGVNHCGSWKDKYGARVADVLVDTVEIANSLQVLAPSLEDGGHQYERHQSTKKTTAAAFGTAAPASAAQSSTLSTVQSNLLDHPPIAAYRQFSDTTKAYHPHQQRVGSGSQHQSNQLHVHSPAMAALSSSASAATGRSLNNNAASAFYYNNEHSDQQQSAQGHGHGYHGKGHHTTTAQQPPLQHHAMTTATATLLHPNLSSVCISPGTLILVLVILGVVLVISASATLWLALRRSEAKKYASAAAALRGKYTTNTLSSYTSNGSHHTPSPTPYYRFSHW